MKIPYFHTKRRVPKVPRPPLGRYLRYLAAQNYAPGDRALVTKAIKLSYHAPGGPWAPRLKNFRNSKVFGAPRLKTLGFLRPLGPLGPAPKLKGPMLETPENS